MNKRARVLPLELLLPLGVIGCLMVIFVPLPTGVMDMLLAANIAVAIIMLLTTMFVRTPIEFSVFPSLLLVTTFARLSLNIATTRLILTEGAIQGESAAGSVIQSFGSFVAGDQIAVGLVIFAIIVIIQFVVITKGATRISEVAARFALDGMPGRQMSIDADLNAGIIDSETARQLREDININADFFGAMDGASKFVRGDAIAGILITAVNIVVGLIVGVMSGMSITEAANIFTMLTIGDGLVSQIPALLISLAAAMLMTRGTNKSNLPRESVDQVFAQPIVLVITAAFLAAMVFTELPKLPLLMLAVSCGGIAWVAFQRPPENDQQLSKLNQANKPADVTIERLLGNDILEMELGIELIRLADPKQGGELLPAVTAIRKQLASQLGVILPKIRIRDNLTLNATEYRILVHGNPVEIGTVFPEYLIATDAGAASAPIVGAVATETTENGQAFWIKPENRVLAEDNGYVVSTATEALSTRLSDLGFKYAPELLTRDATNQLIEETRKTSPAIIEELVPEVMSLKDVQHVLKQLVAEGISIRPMGLILETLCDSVSKKESLGIWQLVEAARRRLAPQITARVLGADHLIRAFAIEDDLHDIIARHCKVSTDEPALEIGNEMSQSLETALRSGAENLRGRGLRPVLFVDQLIRPMMAKFVQDHDISLFVVGSKEVIGASVETVGEISADQVVARLMAA